MIPSATTDQLLDLVVDWEWVQGNLMFRCIQTLQYTHFFMETMFATKTDDIMIGSTCL